VPRPWRLAALFAFLLATVGGGLFGGRLLAVGDELRARLRAYTELVGVAKERSGAEVTHRDLVFASVQGMLRALDPHTSFLTPTAYATMRERQQGSFYGLGILVGVRNGQLTVIAPMEGMPAARLGIRAGDVISTIDGEPTAPLALDEAVQRLKGPKGTQVRITIVRRGLEEPLEFTVTRAEIPQTTVRYAYMIAPGTGYLAIADFARTTGSEVARALADLRAAGMQRLLVDLRNNGGGLLDQAIEVADQFLPAGATIVETRGRVADSEQRFTAGRKGEKLDLPLVVLVNNGTASAAEILAGAIQDHDLGLVVGTQTWGKGLVQTVYNLSYGAGLALTTAKYYTPSGRLIQRDYSSYWDYYTRVEEEEAGEPEGGERLRRENGEAYATDLGRTVYGGGGIAPDVEVELDELPEYIQFLFARNAFFNFALEIERRRPQELGPDWRPEPALIDEFARWLVEQEIDRAEDVARGLEPAASREVVARQLRSEVLISRYGLQAAHAALAEGDAQIRAALGLFDRASELRTRRAGIEAQSAPSRTASLR